MRNSLNRVSFFVFISSMTLRRRLISLSVSVFPSRVFFTVLSKRDLSSRLFISAFSHRFEVLSNSQMGFGRVMGEKIWLCGMGKRFMVFLDFNY